MSKETQVFWAEKMQLQREQISADAPTVGFQQRTDQYMLARKLPRVWKEITRRIREKSTLDFQHPTLHVRSLEVTTPFYNKKLRKLKKQKITPLDL